LQLSSPLLLRNGGLHLFGLAERSKQRLRFGDLR
jgi:hypothetical protein